MQLRMIREMMLGEIEWGREGDEIQGGASDIITGSFRPEQEPHTMTFFGTEAVYTSDSLELRYCSELYEAHETASIVFAAKRECQPC